MWGWRDLNSRSTGLSDDLGISPENTEISAPTAPHRPPRRACLSRPVAHHISGGPFEPSTAGARRHSWLGHNPNARSMSLLLHLNVFGV